MGKKTGKKMKQSDFETFLKTLKIGEDVQIQTMTLEGKPGGCLLLRREEDGLVYVNGVRPFPEDFDSDKSNLEIYPYIEVVFKRWPRCSCSIRRRLQPLRVTKKLTKQDKKMLLNWGHAEQDFPWIQKAANSGCRYKNEKGEQLTTEQVIKILGREEWLSGLARAAYHWTSERVHNGIWVSFDCSSMYGYTDEFYIE